MSFHAVVSRAPMAISPKHNGGMVSRWGTEPGSASASAMSLGRMRSDDWGMDVDDDEEGGSQRMDVEQEGQGGMDIDAGGGR